MINKNGSFSINPIYQKANVFKFGLAGVKINGKWGFINTKGTFIIKPIYENMERMNDSGTGIVKSNGKYGVVNKYGKLVIPCVFDGLGEFHMDGNSCKATLNGKNYDLFKDNTLYDEESKSYISLKKILDLNIKQATNTKLRSDLTTAESYASSQQYNQAINYAQQISKKNPYYKDAQMKILQWKDAMLNMSNNSNNNSNTYVAPQKKSQSEINSCKSICVSNESVCKSNCSYLTTDLGKVDNKYSCLSNCEKARQICESYCEK